ncbi:MAG: hypothetical protein MJE66_25150, partial [Proteobacteria bacterium]|nr:hypothetical protein [Pseudomonadota bacterium]
AAAAAAPWAPPPRPALAAWATPPPPVVPVAFEGGDPTGPRVVLFHDSFGEGLLPFLAEHCSRLAAYEARLWEPELFDSERPDLLIEEWVERHFVRDAPLSDGALAEFAASP